MNLASHQNRDSVYRITVALLAYFLIVTPTYSQQTTPKVDLKRKDGPLPNLNLVLVEPGAFQMGSHYAKNVACQNGQPPKNLKISDEKVPEYCRKNGPAKWFIDESPRHTVIITKRFWISDAEITVNQFRKFVEDTNYVTVAERTGQSLGEDNKLEELDVFKPVERTWDKPWNNSGDIENHPVVHVAWEDARAFCIWLSKTTGQEYRLPTEAEWEYAAKGGQTCDINGTFAWGKSVPSEKALGNLADQSFKKLYPKWKYPVLEEHNDGFARTAPIRSFEPNPWGLYDMSGNVWEWTADTYSKQAYSRRKNLTDVQDPSFSVDAVGFFHTMRGGSYDFEIPFLRVEKRRTLSAVWKQDRVLSSASVGFRVVATSTSN
jgi:formylglycine-generating enzyme required for sulfatase activity